MGVSKAAGDVLSLQQHLASEVELSAALFRFESERIPVGRQIAAYGRQLGASAL